MDVQRLIGEVAKRHNVLIDRCDPVFVTVTLNEALLAEHLRKVQAAMEQATRAAAAASARQTEAARQVGLEVVHAGAKHASDQLRSAGLGLRAQLEQLLQDALARTDRAAAAATRARAASTKAAALAGLGAAVALATALWLTVAR